MESGDTAPHDSVAAEYGAFYQSSLGELYAHVTVEQMCDHIEATIGTEDLSVLDVGCGTCTLLSRLADRVDISEARGIDISERMVERARARLADAPIDRHTVERGDFTEADLGTADYDVVLLQGGVINCIGSPDRVIDRIGRVKTDSGLAFVSTITRYSYALFDLKIRGFEAFTETVTRGHTRDTNDIPIQALRISDLEDVVAAHDGVRIRDVYPKVSYLNHLPNERQQELLDERTDAIYEIELDNAKKSEVRHGLQTEVVLQ